MSDRTRHALRPLVVLVTTVVALTMLCRAAVAGSAPPISDEWYRNLEPYCGPPLFAHTARCLEVAFSDLVAHQERLEEIRSRSEQLKLAIGDNAFDVAVRDMQRLIDASERDYATSSQALLDLIREVDIDDPNAPTMGQDVLVLAWRLSGERRVALLAQAIAAHPAIEAAVINALYQCVLEEIALASPGALRTLLGRLLPANRAAIDRHSVARRLDSAAATIWFPDLGLRALDAAELARAWLAAPDAQGRLDRSDRCYRLLELTYSCITPEMLPGSAPIHRGSAGPYLVGSHAIFPAVADAKPDDAALDLAYTAAFSSYGMRRIVADLIGRFEDLEEIVDRQGRKITELRDAITALAGRIDAVEARLSKVESEVELLRRRIEAVERFLTHDLSTDQVNALLRAVAPILRHDNWVSGPMMQPSAFANDSTFHLASGSTDRLWDELRRHEQFSAHALARWLRSETATGEPWWHQTRTLELVPLGIRRQGLGAPDRPAPDRQVRTMNEGAITDRAAVFGAVASLASAEAPERWSVKYFWFNAWNETAFPDGEGNHEGDWGCVDLTVHVPFAPGEGHDIGGAEVVDAIVHEHGNPHRYPRRDLQFDPESKRLFVFLEAGTNEAHPRAGGAANYKGVGIGPWGLRYPVIREHRGDAYWYDLARIIQPTAFTQLAPAVRNLFDEESLDKDLDVQLVRFYRGQWGEFDDDDAKNMPFVGHDATNPFGPLENAKFRDRAGVIDHR